MRLLRRYERWRRSENDLMSGAIDVFDRLLARGTGRVAELAQRGMPWVGRSDDGEARVHRTRHGTGRRIARRGALDARTMLGIRTERLAGMAAMLIGVASFSFMDAGLKLLDRALPVRAGGRAARTGGIAGGVRLGDVCGRRAAADADALAAAPDPRRAVGVHDDHLHLRAEVELSLAKTYALFFVAPLLIAVFSIFMLGERVTSQQWVAIAVGFAGVLIVLPARNARASAGSARWRCWALRCVTRCRRCW